MGKMLLKCGKLVGTIYFDVLQAARGSGGCPMPKNFQVEIGNNPTRRLCS